MTAASHAEHHDYPALHRYGLWLFIASEAFLFGVLLAVRFAVAGLETPEAVSQLLGVVLTALLLTSSYFVHRAEVAHRTGAGGGVRTNLWVAVALGFVFVVLVGIEWSAGFAEFPASTPYGSAFYLITGTHALHVLSGMLALAALAIQAARGALPAQAGWKLAAGARYWHFIDFVWLTVFTTLYLL